VGQALMTALCRELDSPDVRFGQCLLSPEEMAESVWLRQFGFEPAAELYFLARALEVEIPDADEVPPGAVEVFAESENAARFAALIERTYEGSLDCPLLNGRRTGVDALASHRLSGQFQPRGWRLYRQDGRDAAVLLLNEHPDQDAVELVYFGVAPEFRGQGWGRRVVIDAITLSRSWNRAAIFLAVDAGNTFANPLYAGCGFQEVARRSVWIRFPSGSARQ
jgi:mycothiol synthase